MIPGLRLFCDSHDTIDRTATILIARRCGAVTLSPCIEGVNGHRPRMDDLLRFQEAAQSSDIGLLPFTFPSLIGDLSASRGWVETVCHRLGVKCELDAEPTKIGHGVLHNSPGMLRPWLVMPEIVSITTTRAEAPHLGPHDLPVAAQLESQTSFDTLDQAMRIFTRYTAPERISLVSGVFDKEGDPRTVREVIGDLEVATPQAKLSGFHAVWSAHSLSGPEADALREWTLRTWERSTP